MCLRFEYHLMRIKLASSITISISMINKMMEYQNISQYLKLFIHLIIDNNVETDLLKIDRLLYSVLD